jgi:hypothetical protein
VEHTVHTHVKSYKQWGESMEMDTWSDRRLTYSDAVAGVPLSAAMSVLAVFVAAPRDHETNPSTALWRKTSCHSGLHGWRGWLVVKMVVGDDDGE